MRWSAKALRLPVLLVSVVAVVLGPIPHSVAVTPFVQSDFYSGSKIVNADLQIPNDSLTALTTAPKNFVTAQIRFTMGDKDSGWINIGTHLKGTTSLEPIAGKPSLKVKFNFNSSQRFLGLKAMTFNNMQQDGSKLHEYGYYLMSNAMGVPASRTGWMHVTINGVDKGLYLNIETVDDIFLASRFKDVTGHLYEGIALNDIKKGSAAGDRTSGAFTVDEGWRKVPNKNDLQTLINALGTKKNAIWWSNLNKYFDRAKLINLFALENFFGHWDSYSGPIINNYYIRANGQGKFTMIPWGADQTFGENRRTTDILDQYYFSMTASEVGFPWVHLFHTTKMPRGVIFQRCLNYAPCKTAYLQSLKAVSAKVTSIKLVAKMKAAATTTSSFRNNDIIAITNKAYEFVTTQQTHVKKILKSNGIK